MQLRLDRYTLALVLVFGFLASGCGGGGSSSSSGGGGSGGGGDSTGNDTGGTTISNAQDLSDALQFDGAKKVSGQIGAPTGSNFATTMTGTEEFVVTQNSNSEILLDVTIAESGKRVGAVFLQLDDTDHYYVIPIDENGQPITDGQTLTSTITIASNVALTSNVVCAINAAPCASSVKLTGQPLQDASFSEPFVAKGKAQSYLIADGGDCCAQLFNNDWDGRTDSSNWSEPVAVDFTARNVGSGNIQITLTWGNTADLDLYVVEPDGTEIYFANKTSLSTGGELDVDDLDGFGPENIFYDQEPPAGDYLVQVKHFSGAAPSNYNVSVNVGGSVQSYSGSLGAFESDDITTITIAGDGSSVGVQPLDISGSWSVSSSEDARACGEGISQTTELYQILQSASSISVTDSFGGSYSGTISGNQIQWSGSYPEDGGTVSLTLSATVAQDGQSFQGSTTWTWSDGSESCNGTSTFSAVPAN